MANSLGDNMLYFFDYHLLFLMFIISMGSQTGLHLWGF